MLTALLPLRKGPRMPFPKSNHSVSLLTDPQSGKCKQASLPAPRLPIMATLLFRALLHLSGEKVWTGSSVLSSLFSLFYPGLFFLVLKTLAPSFHWLCSCSWLPGPLKDRPPLYLLPASCDNDCSHIPSGGSVLASVDRLTTSRQGLQFSYCPSRKLN